MQTRETWAYMCSGWRLLVSGVVIPIGMVAGATATVIGPEIWVSHLIMVLAIGQHFAPNPQKDLEELVAFELLFWSLMGIVVGLTFSLLPK